MAQRRQELEKELVGLAQKGAFALIAQNLEEYEYFCAENPKDALPLYGAQLLSYLIENEIHYARFLWRRIPKKIKETDPELNAIWTIGQNVWNKKYTDIYQSAQAYNWSPGTVLFVQAFVEKFRERTFKLISSAYSNISTGDLAVLLGLSEQDAITLAVQHGWTHDAASGSVAPRPIVPETRQGASLDQLQQLTDYVCFLEEN
ncbi:COP9 subunit 8, putative [Acanthamoeba castellanii str. Neff]|uniref:COP9 signalosome complex subunit 8 n=1 Tax=Acanthamoeba castellanii (strain ATCC 30010 / Neff) TaxID=1257118 RepID=L8H5Y4_ACACF|nr:COP9 subunit 8, putative [Acanthamoeba castellanii str. Neff]ELR20934.1 COP9 subunit 8, putative [Acanthamoeba castellanii str. Neff]